VPHTSQEQMELQLKAQIWFLSKSSSEQKTKSKPEIFQRKLRRIFSRSR
jgi:hypothetical protein